MLANIELIKRYLEQVRGLVQTSSQNERAREAAKMKDLYEDAMKPQYGMTEAKTRWSVSSIIRDRKKKLTLG